MIKEWQSSTNGEKFMQPFIGLIHGYTRIQNITTNKHLRRKGQGSSFK